MAASGWTAGKGAGSTTPRGLLGCCRGRNLLIRMCSPADLTVQRHIETNRAGVRDGARADGVGGSDTAMAHTHRTGARTIRTATGARGDVDDCQNNGTRKENQFQAMRKQDMKGAIAAARRSRVAVEASTGPHAAVRAAPAAATPVAPTTTSPVRGIGRPL